MKTVKGQILGHLSDYGTAGTIEGRRFEDCIFQSCLLNMTTNIANRTTVRNVELEACKALNCDVGPAILEDVTISGLRVDDLFIVWGAVFKRVRLSGVIGALKVNRFVHHVDRSDATQGPFDAHRVQFYESVDWALDLRDARFRELDLNAIPARAILRDPETQLIVTRERALDPIWRKRLSPDNEYWPMVIDMFLVDGYEDILLVAPLGAAKKKRERRLRELLELKSAGVAY